MKRRDACASLVVALLGAPSAPRAAPALRSFGEDGWSELLRGHAGRPFVVHFWALSCAPGLVDLPRWRERARQLGPGAVVMVQADVALSAVVLARLRSAGLDTEAVEQWTAGVEFDERIRDAIDRRWSGELPFTVAVDREGRAVALRSGAIDAAPAGVFPGGTDPRRQVPK